jgi:hypothetical protein
MVGDGRLRDIRVAQRAADDGVADRRRLRANQDFARLNSMQAKFLDRRSRAMSDESFKAPPGISAAELRGSLDDSDLRSEGDPAVAAPPLSIRRREICICDVLPVACGICGEVSECS